MKKPKHNQPQYQAKLAALRAAIDEGDASGIARGDVFARVRKAFKLTAPPPSPTSTPARSE